MAVTAADLVYVPVPGSWLKLASGVADHRAPGIFASPTRAHGRGLECIASDIAAATPVELAASWTCSPAAFDDCLTRLSDTSKPYDPNGVDFEHLGLGIDAKLMARLRIKTPEQALGAGFRFLRPDCLIVPDNVYVAGLLLVDPTVRVCLVGCCRGSRFLSGPAPTWSELISIANLRLGQL